MGGTLAALASVVAIALATGCVIDVDYTGTRFSCDVAAEDEACPGGMTCVAGFCESAAGTADASVSFDAAQAPDAQLPDAGPTLVKIRVGASGDDAEEDVADSSVDLLSTDIELTVEPVAIPVTQIVGMRFVAVPVPNGAQILESRLQFTADELDSVATTVQLRGQRADDTDTFTDAVGNVSGRPRTTASVNWTIPAWETAGAQGDAQRTPDLAAIIQEIVDRPGWTSGNSIVIVVTGTGTRHAHAFDGVPASAPELGIQFQP